MKETTYDEQRRTLTRPAKLILDAVGVDADSLPGDVMVDVRYLAEADSKDGNLSRATALARLALLPSIELDAAIAFESAGGSIELLASGDAAAVRAVVDSKDYPLDEAPGRETIHDWMIDASVARGEQERPQPVGLPSFAEVDRFNSVPESRPRRSLWVAEATTWSKIAKRVYRDASQDRARSLALANGSREESVAAGTRVVVPVFSSDDVKLPTEDAVVEGLRVYASYLNEDEARAIAADGVMEPRDLLFLRADDSPRLGVRADLIDRLKVQTMISFHPAFGADVAAGLAKAGGLPTAFGAGRASVDDVQEMLGRAEASGHVAEGTTAAIGRDDIWGLIVDASKRFPGGRYPWRPVGNDICNVEASKHAPLEDLYSVRYRIAGKSALVLEGDVDAVEHVLDLINSAQRLGELPARIGEIKARVASAFNIDEEVLQQWGVTLSSSPVAAAILIRDHLTQFRDALDLLVRLTRAHEAFHHREYGQALALYNQVQSWFHTAPGRGYLKYVQHVDIAGVKTLDVMRQVDEDGFLIPGFDQQEADNITGYFSARASASQRSTLLEKLELDWGPMLNRVRIKSSDESTPDLPGKGSKGDRPPAMRSMFYHIYHLMVPMSRADCLSALGEHCAALEELYTIHFDPVFVDKIGAADERKLAVSVQEYRRPDAPEVTPGDLPVIVEAFERDNTNTHFQEWLNPLEKEAVKRRVARTMLSWADLLFRQNNVAKAKPLYAQVLRIYSGPFQEVEGMVFASAGEFQTAIESARINPLTVALTGRAKRQLYQANSGLNYLGLTQDYVPSWPYEFLLNSGRYFAHHSRQLERDSLNFLASAESEQANLNALMHKFGTAQSQLAVEDRRVAEAAQAGVIAGLTTQVRDQQIFSATDKLDEIDNFEPAKKALGIMGGALSGAGSGQQLFDSWVGGLGGGIFGGISAYFSVDMEITEQRNAATRQKLEAEKLQAVALAEEDRAAIQEEIAEMNRQMAAANAAYALESLLYAQTKTLNADTWFTLANRVGDIANDYLEQGILAAFLAEQTFEFDQERRIDRIKFDYASVEGFLAADALLRDLDSIEAERIGSERNSDVPVRHVIRLRGRDFAAFNDFKRSGHLAFYTGLFEFDFAYPGSYHRRIQSVEIEIHALAPPEGIRGALTKSGVSLMRFRDPDGSFTAGLGNVQDDWIEHTPGPFKIAPVVLPDETMMLSSYDARRDGSLIRINVDPERHRVFEGSGLGTAWLLDLSPCANELDFSTITDVNVILYYSAQFDRGLQEQVELEIRKMLALESLSPEKTRGFSFREMFPDAFYALVNPIAPATEHLRRRTVRFRTIERHYPRGERNRAINSIVLGLANRDGLVDARPRLSSVSRSPAFDPSAPDNGVVDWFPGPAQDWSTTAASFPVVASGSSYLTRADTSTFTQEPVDTWMLQLRAEDCPGLARTDGGGNVLKFEVDGNDNAVLDGDGNPNPDPAGKPLFDEAKLAALLDMLAIQRYRFDYASCGSPVDFWHHFSAGPQPSWVDASAALHSANWITDPGLSPSPAASFAIDAVTKRMAQQTAGAEGLLRPDQTPTWTDVEVDLDFELPATAGGEAGLALRATPVDAAVQSGYIVRIERKASGDCDVHLGRLDAGVATELGVKADVPLDPDFVHRVKVSAVEDRLLVFVDNMLLVTANDATHANGIVEIYAKEQVSFSDISVCRIR